MSTKQSRKVTPKAGMAATAAMPVVNAQAAGIDVGSRSHYLAVGQGHEDVYEFGVTTAGHAQAIEILKHHRITTIAMESTGTYWQPLFNALQDEGFEVLLVNGRQTKNIRGKTDVKDCQWLQKLHSLGLLSGSFLPESATLALRTFSRHRSSLTEAVARYTLKLGAVPDSNSRIVILTQYAKSGSSTLTHELGHALGLKHTFEGDNGGTTCPPTTSCTTTGDMVCDTEPDKSWPNCSATTNPCTGTAYKGVQFNYMNYSSCRDRFTAGQRDRMQYFLSTTWNSLRYSRTGDPKATVAMVPAKCTNGEVTPGVGVLGPTLVSFKDIYHASGIKYEEGHKAYVDNTCSYRTSVSPGMTYPLTIGIQGNVQDIRVYLDYNNDGTFQVPSEEIYSVRSSVATGTQSTNITIPTSGVVRNKPLRLRVVTDYPQISGLGPCVALGSGQAEDYAVTVSDNLAVSQPWEASQPLVYPNPANDAVNISFPGSFTGTVSMYNAVGQIVSSMSVHNKTTCLVKTDTYPAGCYTLHLKEDNGVFTTMKINVYH